MDFVLALCAAAGGRSSRVLGFVLGWALDWGVWRCGEGGEGGGGGDGGGRGAVGKSGRGAVMGEDMMGGGG